MARNNQKRGGGRREKPEYDQKLLNLARVTRVVKGGRRFRFRATLVIGNRKGKVGVGVAKGSDVSDAIKKAFQSAKKEMVTIVLTGNTIAHDVTAKYGSAKVLLKPASQGRGLIAGGAVRAVMDLLGAKDISAKSLGSSNNLNVARATVLALQKLKTRKIEVVKEVAPREEKAEAKEATE
ncbi:MAG: 30S ribosomal protein S5 [Candidatus Moraniibacteriota bacterium]